MTCAETERLVEAYADGELDAAAASALDMHVQSCAACRAKIDAVRSLSVTLRAAPYFRAPGALVRAVEGARPTAPARHLGRTLAPWLVAAAAVLMAAVSWLRPQQAPTHESVTADAVLSSHLRSLVPDRLVDVAASDVRTVKPWLDGRLSFSPAVVDLANAGFPLAGARVDYVAGHPAAALVYRRHDHVISVLVWPTTNPAHAIESRDDPRGYRFRYWDEAGMDYWIVSDVAATDLDEFVTRLHTAVERGS